MKIRTAILATGILFGLSSYVAADDYQNAIRVLDAGDSIGAVKYFEACTAIGDTRCEVALASFYQRGEGLRIDLGRAFDLYRRAARKGDAIAQINLAEIYETGLIAAENMVEAYFWYSLAADQGKEWAAAKADKLSVQISVAKKVELQKRKKLFLKNL